MSEERRASLRKTAIAWKRNNPERNRAIYNAWRKAFPEKVVQASAAWKLANTEHCKQYSLEWSRKNAVICRARTSARNAAQLQRTPKWVDMAAILAIYKACPKDMAVDHIVPLQGKRVSGLHVPWNLQYLTQAENSRKNNRFECG
jgi:5-methylcytosine-specific restriction endonuclease McrA